MIEDVVSLDMYAKTFGGGSGSIVLNDVQCTGSEARLSNCHALSQHNCDHSDDVGVKCLNGMY